MIGVVDDCLLEGPFFDANYYKKIWQTCLVRENGEWSEDYVLICFSVSRNDFGNSISIRMIAIIPNLSNQV